MGTFRPQTTISGLVTLGHNRVATIGGKVLTYDEMLRWSKVFDLLANRVELVNQMLGCRYAHSPTNPMRVVRVKGGYDVVYASEVLATFGIWDLESIDCALKIVDDWRNCVWLLGREGYITCA